MPAVTLGLAEVTERLRVLRRRLNAFTVLQALCVSVSALCLTAAMLLFLGLRGSTVTFRAATWGGILASLGALLGAFAFVRRRWVDDAQTAHLTDRRAQLTDRLTTLFDLGIRPRASRLAPLLVAQTLALGARWHVQRITPRRVPRSMFLLLASLLMLGAAPFIALESAPRRESATNAGAVAAALDGGASPAELRRAQAADNPNIAPTDSAAQLPNMPPLSKDRAAPVAGASAGPLPQSKPQADNALAALPDQLQEAIRRTFRAEAADQPRELTARPEPQPGSADGDNEARSDGEGPPRNAADAKEREQPGPGAGQQQAGNRAGTHDERSQRPDAPGPNQKLDGTAPAAGDGSSPSDLMAAATDGQPLGHDAPQSFKLTITSFLRAVEQKESTQRPAGPRSATTDRPIPAAGALPALNDQQLPDDALRKAEIPPEYEDIVRQVYSLRADR